MEFQPHPPVKIEPNITPFVFTLRVIHNPPPQAHYWQKYNTLRAIGDVKSASYLGNPG